MLRRRLLTRVGLLICAFVMGAVGAIWFLQDVLADIDHSNEDAAVLIDGVQSVSSSLIAIESARQTLGAGIAEDPVIWSAVQRIKDDMARLGKHPVTQAPAGPAASSYVQLAELLPSFFDQVTSHASTPGSEFVETSMRVTAAVQRLAGIFRAHVAEEQRSVGSYFRAMVFVLTLSALVMVNVAIFVLLRTANLVLKPVSELLDGSRELAAEHFAHRVRVNQDDEFGELAHAYNHLAEQLQANEERKTETLRQLAVTLNHGLNNAMSIIELQLGLLDRESGRNPTLGKHLREIRGCLTRMTGIVASLKQIRRVVLTDYAPGLKMVDLERSVGAEDPGEVAQEPVTKSS